MKILEYMRDSWGGFCNSLRLQGMTKEFEINVSNPLYNNL